MCLLTELAGDQNAKNEAENGSAPAATYCLFELLGYWQAYTMFPELQVFQC